MDRSDVEAVKRWLLLVRQFKAVASKLPTIDPVLLNGLDARMKDIESLRDVQDNPDSLLAVPSYAGPLADMNSHKKYDDVSFSVIYWVLFAFVCLLLTVSCNSCRRAKHIMDTYQPLLLHLRVKLEVWCIISICDPDISRSNALPPAASLLCRTSTSLRSRASPPSAPYSKSIVHSLCAPLPVLMTLSSARLVTAGLLRWACCT
jgi:hypothetical protein